MVSQEIIWGFGSAVVLSFGMAVALGFYIAELCNDPIRKRRRQTKRRKKLASKEINFLKSVNLDGTKIVKFAEMYKIRLKEDFLYKEFNALLSRYRQKQILEKAEKKANIKKNIFEDHIPFQHNAVEIGQKNKDYINASWIRGVDCEKMYIITQVPLKKTLWDFWKMIWIHECRIIVMINKIIHDGVIVDYLNPLNYTVVNPFFIEIKGKMAYCEYIKRVIILHHNNEKREIAHFQFTSWTNISVIYPQIILDLRKQMKIEWLYCRSPIVVHCFTGCGRSGTFVAICNLCDTVDKLKESRNDERISVPYEVMNLRESRYLSVPNLNHYSMIYGTIVDYITGGVTTISLHNLESEFETLSIVSPTTGKTLFERQFENAKSRTHPLYGADCAGGLRTENRDKNRLFDVIPRDYDRPYLKNIISNKSSDYINAVYIDSYNWKRNFLVTQWPMQNSSDDLWRMIFENKIHAVLLLDGFEDTETCPIFWPNTLNQSEDKGSLEVQLIRDHTILDCIRCQVFTLTKKKFRLKNSEIAILKSNNIKVKSVDEIDQWEVTFFNLINWKSDQLKPEKLENIVDIIYLVQEYHNLKCRLLKPNVPPITIVSKDGVERAGIICVVAECLETMKNSYEIDIFSSVLKIRRNRPQLIPNLTEYVLCYEICLEHFTLLNKKNEANLNEKTN